jgi:hypothetical protein
MSPPVCNDDVVTSSIPDTNNNVVDANNTNKVVDLSTSPPGEGTAHLDFPFPERINSFTKGELEHAKTFEAGDDGLFANKTSAELGDLYLKVRSIARAHANKYNEALCAVATIDPAKTEERKQEAVRQGLDFLKTGKAILARDALFLEEILNRRELGIEGTPLGYKVNAAAATKSDEDLPDLEPDFPKKKPNKNKKKKLKRFVLRDSSDQEDMETQRDSSEQIEKELETLVDDDCACDMAHFQSKQALADYQRKMKELLADNNIALGTDNFMRRLHQVAGDMMPGCHCFATNPPKLCMRCAQVDFQQHQTAQHSQKALAEELHAHGEFPISDNVLLENRGRSWKVPKTFQDKQLDTIDLVATMDHLAGNAQLFEPLSNKCSHCGDLAWLQLVLPTLLHLLELMRHRGMPLTRRNKEYAISWTTIQTRTLLKDRAETLETACHVSSNHGYRRCLEK